MTKAELMQKMAFMNGDIDKLFDVLFWIGKCTASIENRKNENWDIECIISIPKRNEENVEIVIGNRHTDFQPYVTWHCLDKSKYMWGHYCQTIDGVKEEAKQKLRMELGMYREEM